MVYCGFWTIAKEEENKGTKMYDNLTKNEGFLIMPTFKLK
jgi:hypothetical protein